MNPEPELLVYQAENGAIQLKADAKQETIWATQKQLAHVFGVNIPTINEHIKNIFKIGELDEKATIRKFRIVQKEGNREVARQLEHYNLDMIISVGYRVNSKTATQFRKWATQTLKQHITQGYTINPARIEKNLETFLHAVKEVKTLAKNNPQLHTDNVLALITAFGEDVYPTLEEKAANLLYFIVKNHVFNDGNKRTGAFSFIWFLQQAGIDFQGRLTPEALTTITLLIAESEPKNKQRMIGLVILLLTGKHYE